MATKWTHVQSRCLMDSCTVQMIIDKPQHVWNLQLIHKLTQIINCFHLVPPVELSAIYMDILDV